MIDLIKICTVHGQLSAADIKKRKNRKSLECNLCNKKYLKEYRKKNKEKLNKADKEYYHKNKEKFKLKTKKYYECNIEKIKIRDKKYRENNKELIKNKKSNYYFKCQLEYFKKNLKKNFNITIHDYELMMIEQNNVCKICNKNESRIDKKNNCPIRLSVDHCHKTGKIRGLLCSKCNTMIGLADESESIMVSAIKYLRSSRRGS